FGCSRDLSSFPTRRSSDLGKVVMEKMGGDHFVLYDKLDHTINQFTMEADVTIQDGSSAALVFGVKDKNLPSASWHAANFNSNNQDRKSTRLNSSHVSISYA